MRLQQEITETFRKTFIVVRKVEHQNIAPKEMYSITGDL